MRKVKYEARELERFRRRARKRYPEEYIETLWGRIEPDAFYVEKFVPVPFRRYGRLSIEYDKADALKLFGEQASKLGLIWIGSIHSHPDSSGPEPTDTDNAGARQDGEHVFAIYELSRPENSKRLRSKTVWWPTQIPVEAAPI